MMMAGTHTASERLNARRAGSTTQAKRRVVIRYRAATRHRVVIGYRAVIRHHVSIRHRVMINRRVIINRRVVIRYRVVIGYRAVIRHHVSIRHRVVINHRMMINHRVVIRHRAATGHRVVIGYRAGTVTMQYGTGTVASVRNVTMSHISDMPGVPYPSAMTRCDATTGGGTPSVIIRRGTTATTPHWHTPSATTRRGFTTRHGFTTRRGFAAGVVLPAPDGASHLSEMLRGSVVEEIFLLDFSTVLCEEGSVLFWKRHTAVVFLLPGNVAHDLVFFVITLRESGILFGPAFEKREMRVGLEPFAGGDLELLDELGHRQGGRQGDEKMHVIGHAPDTVKVAPLVPDESIHVGVKFPLMFLHDGGDPGVRAENDVVIRLCVTHNFVHSFCYYFVHCMMITERCPDYCVGRISPRCFFLLHTPDTSRYGYDTTTRRGFAACMVLIAPDGASHVSDMVRHSVRDVPPHTASERRHAHRAINTTQAKRSVVITQNTQRICKQ